jgi:hypothetical protein
MDDHHLNIHIFSPPHQPRTHPPFLSLFAWEAMSSLQNSAQLAKRIWPFTHFEVIVRVFEPRFACLAQVVRSFMPKRPRGNEWGGGGAHQNRFGRRSRGSGDAEADHGDKVAGTEIHPEVETVLHRLPDGVVRQALSFLAGVCVGSERRHRN